jgi:hypothetical protein
VGTLSPREEAEMPHCFQLFPNGAEEPAKLVAIDEAICAHLGVEPHETRWRSEWVDTIGVRLGMGQSWDEIDAVYAEYGEDRWAVEVRKIVAFLRANYTPNVWRQVGRLGRD